MMLQDITRSSFNPGVLESSGSFFSPWLQFSQEATATKRLDRGTLGKQQTPETLAWSQSRELLWLALGWRLGGNCGLVAGIRDTQHPKVCGLE